MYHLINKCDRFNCHTMHFTKQLQKKNITSDEERVVATLSELHLNVHELRHVVLQILYKRILGNKAI